MVVDERVAASPGGELEAEIAILYSQLAKELHRLAAATLQQHDDASDAVQETFLRYFSERKSGSIIEDPRSWLYRVLSKQVQDRLAKAVKHEVTQYPVEPLDEARDPESRMMQSQNTRQLKAYLSVREFDCLRLRAQGLGIRSGTEGALLSRVRGKLLGASEDRRSGVTDVVMALGTLLQDGGTRSS